MVCGPYKIHHVLGYLEIEMEKSLAIGLQWRERLLQSKKCRKGEDDCGKEIKRQGEREREREREREILKEMNVLKLALKIKKMILVISSSHQLTGWAPYEMAPLTRIRGQR